MSRTGKLLGPVSPGSSSSPVTKRDLGGFPALIKLPLPPPGEREGELFTGVIKPAGNSTSRYNPRINQGPRP
jgi:hypothetical protein